MKVWDLVKVLDETQVFVMTHVSYMPNDEFHCVVNGMNYNLCENDPLMDADVYKVRTECNALVIFTREEIL